MPYKHLNYGTGTTLKRLADKSSFTQFGKDVSKLKTKTESHHRPKYNPFKTFGRKSHYPIGDVVVKIQKQIVRGKNRQSVQQAELHRAFDSVIARMMGRKLSPYKRQITTGASNKVKSIRSKKSPSIKSTTEKEWWMGKVFLKPKGFSVGHPTLTGSYRNLTEKQRNRIKSDYGQISGTWSISYHQPRSLSAVGIMHWDAQMRNYMKSGQKRNYMSYMPTVKGTGFLGHINENYPNRIQKPVIPSQHFWGSYPNFAGVLGLFKLELSEWGIAMVRRFNSKVLNGQIREAIQFFHALVYEEGSNLIERYAPRDTGALRKSLKESISAENSIMPSATANSLTLEMRLFSNLKYSGIISNMTNEQVRHPKWYVKTKDMYKKLKEPLEGTYKVRNPVQTPMRSRKTGKILFDPFATHSFFYDIKKELKKRIVKYSLPAFENRVALIPVFAFYKMSRKDIRSMFKISGLGTGH